MSSISSNKLSFSTGYHLFKHTSSPVCLYGSEIWGVFNSTGRKDRTVRNNDSHFPLEEHMLQHPAEVMQRKFLRFCLGLSRSAINLAVYGESGAFPMYISMFRDALDFSHHAK